jgi:hypothetical protein
MTETKPKRRWFRFSLRTLFLICLYFAICSTIYLSANLWLGTLVVLATIIWLVATTAHAFKQHDYFSFGFSVFGWACLVFWLGFYAETAGRSGDWELPHAIFRAMCFFRERPIWDPSAPVKIYGTIYSIYQSGQMSVSSPIPFAPSFLNAIRLAVCVTALFVGVIGGVVAYFIGRKRGTDQLTKGSRDTSTNRKLLK